MTHKPGHFLAFCSRVTNCLSSSALPHTNFFTFAQDILCPLPLIPLDNCILISIPFLPLRPSYSMDIYYSRERSMEVSSKSDHFFLYLSK